MSLLRLTKVTSGASKAWTPEFYFTKPMEFVYFMYNFESFFVFIFLCFFLKQRKPLRFDAISCFHLAHFMISICKKISSKENQTTETWRNLHSTFHQKKSSKSSSHYLTWNTYSAFILTFLHHSTRILMLLMQLMQLSCHQIGIWNEIFRVGIPNVPCQAQWCTVTIVLCPGHSHLTVSHLSNLFWQMVALRIAVTAGL